jgi:hypothetical protein
MDGVGPPRGRLTGTSGVRSPAVAQRVLDRHGCGGWRFLRLRRRLYGLAACGLALGSLVGPVVGWRARTGSATGPGYRGGRPRVLAPIRRIRVHPIRGGPGRGRRTRRAGRGCDARLDRSTGRRLRRGRCWSSSPHPSPVRAGLREAEMLCSLLNVADRQRVRATVGLHWEGRPGSARHPSRLIAPCTSRCTARPSGDRDRRVRQGSASAPTVGTNPTLIGPQRPASAIHRDRPVHLHVRHHPRGAVQMQERMHVHGYAIRA